jgi:hypothetical protein
MLSAFAPHAIEEPGRFSFSAPAYSRFKFGDGAVARQFGHELADAFIADELPGLPADAALVVLPSPFAFIPTASYWLAMAFLRRLNRHLAHTGRAVATTEKIGRRVTYRDDYGALTAAERLHLIGRDRFWIDANALTSKTLLFVDDVRITGSHQVMMERMLTQHNLTNPHRFLYYAQLTNPAVHPNVENALNYARVRTLDDLDDIIDGPDFRFNTRVVKFMLSHTAEQTQPFLLRQSAGFRAELLDLAIGNEYHLIPEYAAAVGLLTGENSPYSAVREPVNHANP